MVLFQDIIKVALSGNKISLRRKTKTSITGSEVLAVEIITVEMFDGVRDEEEED